jgi:hypothetical protein
MDSYPSDTPGVRYRFRKATIGGFLELHKESVVTSVGMTVAHASEPLK